MTTAPGPQEQRLRALLEAREKEIQGVGEAWRQATVALDEVEVLLGKAKTEVRDAVGGKESGPAAANAVQHFHDDLKGHRAHLKRAAETLSATAGKVEHVRGRYAALGGVPARPELKTDPGADEDKALEDQARHEDAVGAWEAARQERERKCGEMAQDLEGSLDESIEVMKSIHGEPDGGGGAPGAPGAPVTHTPTVAPGPGPSYTPPPQVPGTSAPGITPGVVTQIDGPGHQVPVQEPPQGPTHTPVEPLGNPETGIPDYQPPTHGDPGSVPGSPGVSGGSGGPGLGTLGMAAGGLVGGAGLAKGISRALGAGSPLSRSARLGPSAVKGAGGTVGRAGAAGSPVRGAAGGRGGKGVGGAKGVGRAGAGAAGAAGGRGARGAGAGAAAGRGRGKGKGRDGQASGDIFDTEQEWYDDESQPGVLD